MSFNGDGRVITRVQTSAGAHDIASQPDGKIVVAGYSWGPGEIHFALVRYTRHGGRDRTFSRDGKVSTAIRDGAAARGVAIQPAGRIVAAGFAIVGHHDRFAVARYKPSGALDRSFRGDGRLTTALGTQAAGTAMALQRDGKIVVVGSSDQKFAVVRYKPSGRLDRTFSGDGKVRTRIGIVYAEARAVAIAPDGKIVVAGEARINGKSRFAVVRYRPNGSLDRSFGKDGKVTTRFGVDDRASGVVIQPDGKIVVAGSTADKRFGYRFGLARYQAGGGLDPTFGGDGRVRTSFGDTDANAFDVALSNGKPIAVGRTGAIGGSFQFALSRYKSNGRRDGTFSADGRVVTRFRHGAIADTVAVQPNGRIVAFGENVRRHSKFVGARYMG